MKMVKLFLLLKNVQSYKIYLLSKDGKTYFTTPCTAIIEGVADEVQVKCAWDLDYLLKERQFNEYDDYIGSGTQSESAYLKFLMEDSEQRSGEETPIPM